MMSNTLPVVLWTPTRRTPIAWPRLWLCVFVLGAAVSGCPKQTGPDQTLPLLTTDDPEAEAEIRAAREAANSGRETEAQTRYDSFLVEHADDPLVPVAQLGLGRLKLAQGDLEGAMALFDQVAAHSDDAVAERGRFYRGVTLHLQGDHAGALELLLPLRGRTVDPEETSLLLRTVAAAALETGDQHAAIEALDGLLREAVPESDRVEARQRLEELIANELDPEQLTALYDAIARDGEAWPLLAQRELRSAFDRGDLQRVRDVAEALSASGHELPPELAVMAMRAERTGTADPRVIGAILPLSGRGRAAGLAALRGLSLAAGSPPTGPIADDAIQLVHRDSGSAEGDDPDLAAAAVDELVTMHRVIAIIGPIGAEASRRAAARAQDLGVPLITLSPLHGIETTGPMVFRGIPSARDEAEALVARAMRDGHTRLAILHANHTYGQAFRDAAQAAAAAAGAHWAGAVEYPAGASSIGDQVTAVRALRPDALLVGDASTGVQVVAPSLAAVGLWSVAPGGSAPSGGRVIGLYLPSVAQGRGLRRNAGRYLQGATLSQPFWPGVAGPAREFNDAYEARFGEAPTMLSAYAFDALSAIEAQVNTGVSSRESVADGLAGAQQLTSAGASLGFSVRRAPRRATRLLQLISGEWVARDE